MPGDTSARIAIRRAEPEEHAILLALMTRASLANPGDREALRAHPEVIVLPLSQLAAGHVFVAERDGTAVGFVALEPRAGDGMELDGLFVEPALWRQGIGRALVMHAIAFARSCSAATLHVTSGHEATRLYAACGFVLTGTVEAGFGPAPRMCLELCDAS